jgi:hypothetical protein
MKQVPHDEPLEKPLLYKRGQATKKMETWRQEYEMCMVHSKEAVENIYTIRLQNKCIHMEIYTHS